MYKSDGGNMDRESYLDFARGLSRAIAEAGYGKGEFAKGIMNPVTLSNNLSETNPTMMVERNRFACAKKLGMDVQDIINMGRSVRTSIRVSGTTGTTTVAGRDAVTKQERRQMTSREQYFWDLYKEIGDADIMDEFIRTLVDRKRKGET